MMEGRQLAETIQGPEKQQLLATCDNVQRLSKELADLKARGMVGWQNFRLINKKWLCNEFRP